MIRYDGFNYIGEIKVGQPGKLFRVLLDSGSGELWLPTSDCNGIDTTIVNTYDQKQSSTFRDDGRQVKLRYVNGVAIMGYLGREFFQFGDLAIQNMTFIRIDSTSNGRNLQSFHIDGILGLKLDSSAGYADVEAPIHQILRAVGQQSGGGAKSMLSFSLNHGADRSKAGEMIIGGLDESLYTGEITWTPLMRSKRWQFRVESIELKYTDNDGYWETSNTDLTVCEHGCDATADTGTMVIAGNARDIQAMNEKIGARHIGNGIFKLPSCKYLDSKLPTLSVTISGRKFSLTPSQYTLEEDGVCYSSLRVMDPRMQDWILGNMFIGHFYTILDFDNQRFGLAESPFKSAINVASVDN